MQKVSPFKESFRSVGPSVMGGRVVDLAVNEDDPTEFFVAYASGGLWHTINNGQSFTPVFDSSLVIGIGAVAVDWKKRTIWLGTGEANSSRSSYSGIGICKSGDFGKTWQFSGLPESHHIGRILLHPKDPLTAWVAVTGHLYTPNAERGVYKTTDGGKNWRRVLFVDANTGAIDLAINPANSSQLYACMWYRTRTAWNFEESGGSSGIYKSNNGGENWKLVTGKGSGFPSGDGMGRTGIAIYPKDPSIIYAVVDNQSHLPDTAKKADTFAYTRADLKSIDKKQFKELDDKRLDSFLRKNGLTDYSAAKLKQLVSADSIKPTALYDYLYDANEDLFDTPITGCEVYRSLDSGIHWQRMNREPLKLYNTYGYYFGKVFVSPADASKLLIPGYSLELSTDSGRSFKSIDKENVHGDHHTCWIDPHRDSHMVIGNDGGVNITYDNGEHWFKANSPAVGQFYSVTTDNAFPYRVYGGLQDNGVWYGYTKRRPVSDANIDTLQYAPVIDGDGMMVQVDRRDNKTVYSGYQFGYYSRSHTDTGGYFSIHPQNKLGEVPYRYNWCTPILLSRHNEDILYMGSNKFNVSYNKGNNMKPVSDDLTNGGRPGDVSFGTITTISESPLRFGLICAGTDDGNICLSTNGGYTWTKISSSLQPAGLWVSRVLASRFSEQRIYATINGYRNDHFNPYVFVSNDLGKTWRSVAANLPMEPVNVIVEDPNKDSVLYVGTDGGVYVSTSGGKSWDSWSRGLPLSVPVYDITIQEREQEILLGTHGRSIYVSKLPTAPKEKRTMEKSLESREIKASD